MSRPKPPKPERYAAEEQAILKDPRTLKRFTEIDLHPAEQRTLDFVIKYPGITAAEIALTLNITPPTIGCTVTRLVALGRVERKKIITIDDTGSTHRAFALYVKDKK